MSLAAAASRDHLYFCSESNRIVGGPFLLVIAGKMADFVGRLWWAGQLLLILERGDLRVRQGRPAW
jgi:hypothetical protein